MEEKGSRFLVFISVCMWVCMFLYRKFDGIIIFGDALDFFVIIQVLNITDIDLTDHLAITLVHTVRLYKVIMDAI